VASDPAGPEATFTGAASILVPELRDYQQINAEILRRLNLGQKQVRLEGVAGQRLLLAQLAGAWTAVIEVQGDAGPELAAELDAPGLTVVCRGAAADGAGRGMVAGTLVILGPAGVALGYAQRGGLIIACREVGARAGLGQSGGDIVLLDRAGALTGERQSGGRLLFQRSLAGAHAGHGSRGGRRLEIPASDDSRTELDTMDRRLVDKAFEIRGRFFPGVSTVR
jgi:glutamate synthase domain-containing protein 3